MRHVAGGREPRDSKARGGVQGCNVYKGDTLNRYSYIAMLIWTSDLLYKCCFFVIAFAFRAFRTEGKFYCHCNVGLLDQWKHPPQTYPPRLVDTGCLNELPLIQYSVEGYRPGNPSNRPMAVLTRNWPYVCPPAHHHFFVGPVAGSVRNTSCRRDALETIVTPRRKLPAR